ncbi:MAG: twin-arginine translocation signal domain-containing protein, partial [Acidobacteriaceae bacterium]
MDQPKNPVLDTEESDQNVPTKEKEREPVSRESRFGRFSRRSFLAQLGAAGVAATASPLAHAVDTDTAEKEASAGVPGAVPVT